MSVAAPRLAALLAVLGLLGCQSSSPPANAVFACESSGACPGGKECRQGFCFPVDAGCGTCALLNRGCGPTQDLCGQPLDCGGCPTGRECRQGFCASTDAGCGSCALLNLHCGPAQDLCGQSLDCGNCTAPLACDKGVCGCKPKTNAEVCGARTCGTVTQSDGCSSTLVYSCGSCGTAELCFDGGCCVPQTDRELCQAAGVICGPITAIDRCGQARSPSCSGCDAGTSCNFSDPVPSCQACSPETEGEFCNRHGANCGQVAGIDNCGFPIDAGCGTCSTGITCGAAGPNQCTCQPLLAGCVQNNQCCAGTTCGHSSLCCVPTGGACGDSAECCRGSCNATSAGAVCADGDGGLD